MKSRTIALVMALTAVTACAVDSFGDPLTPHAAATTLPNPPTSWAPVRSWSTARDLVFDYEVWADATVAVTGLTLLGGLQKDAPAIADDTVDSVTAVADTLTVTGHLYKNGDGPFTLAGADLPGGLAAATNYWFTVVDANTLKVHSSFDNWLAMSAIDITSVGSGVQTIADITSGDDATRRVHWLSYGLLGPAGDGVVSLTAQGGYTSRVAHRPRTIAYAFAGTVSAATTIEISLVRAAR